MEHEYWIDLLNTLESWEVAHSMDSDRETAKQREGRPASISNVLSGSGAGGITIWGRDLGFVGGNVPEAGGIARGIPQIDDRAEGKAEEGRYL